MSVTARAEGLPTFIIGGAMKAGTTSLWAWVCEHPEIGMASGKEPRFFTRERGLGDGGGASAPPRSGRYAEGLDWYLSLYADCTDKAIRGEASSRYLHAPDAAELISAALPDVRLIFVLRDPVDRAYAHYRHERRFMAELPDFETLVRQDHARLRRYLDDSSYATLLARYFARFRANQVIVLFTDELELHPLATARRAFEFIGADPSFVPATLAQVHNASARTAFPSLQRWLTVRSHTAWRQRLPGPLAGLALRVKQGVIRLNERPASYEAMPAAIRERLIAALDDEIVRTEGMLDRDLSHWRRVHDGG